MKLKRVIATILSAVMALSLAACGGSEKKEEESDASGEKTLKLWTIATESDSYHDAYIASIADYEKAHPGVKIEMETFENESYKTKLKSAVAANELPDIFYTWSGGFSSNFIKTGNILPVDEYFEEYKDQISEAAIVNGIYDGKLYGTPACASGNTLFYNRKIFEDNKVKVPETLEELKTACKQLKDAGITPISTSVKEVWLLLMFADPLFVQSTGSEAAQKAVSRQGEFAGDDFVKAAQAIVDLKEQGAFIEGATGLSNDEAMQEFCQGNAAMCITGAWLSGVIENNAENPSDFDCAPIPNINPDKATVKDLVGGGADLLMVSAGTKDKELAGNAALEIMKGVSKYAYLGGAGIPAWEVDYEVEGVLPLMQKIQSMASDAASFTLNFNVVMDAEDAGAYEDLMQQLFVGDITAEEMVETMNKQLGN